MYVRIRKSTQSRLLVCKYALANGFDWVIMTILYVNWLENIFMCFDWSKSEKIAHGGILHHTFSKHFSPPPRRRDCKQHGDG